MVPRLRRGPLSFFAVDGKAPTAGTGIKEGGKNSVKGPVGNATVETCIPKASGEKKKGSPPSTLTDHVDSQAILVSKCLPINDLRRSISTMEGR
jgi:hypothetical protein